MRVFHLSILSALSVFFISCITDDLGITSDSNTPGAKGDTIGDFSPISVGDHWRFSGKTKEAFHTAGLAAPSGSLVRDVVIQNKWENGDTIYYEGVLVDSSFDQRLWNGTPVAGFRLDTTIFHVHEVDGQLGIPKEIRFTSFFYRRSPLDFLIGQFGVKWVDVSKTKTFKVNGATRIEYYVVTSTGESTKPGGSQREAIKKWQNIGLAYYEYLAETYPGTNVSYVYQLINYNRDPFNPI
jgi:hypothetical protein